MIARLVTAILLTPASVAQTVCPVLDRISQAASSREGRNEFSPG